LKIFLNWTTFDLSKWADFVSFKWLKIYMNHVISWVIYQTLLPLMKFLGTISQYNWISINKNGYRHKAIQYYPQMRGPRVMVFNPTFNNISVISWLSVLLVEETGVPGENHRNATSHWQTLSYIVVSSTPRLSRIRTHNVSGDRY
jgi:hypothetical protein